MLQAIIDSLVSGMIYSLVALGFALVYNSTKVFHVAAAAVYVLAAEVFYDLSQVSTMKMPLLLAALIAILMAMAVSLAMEWLVYRPLKRRGASNNVSLVASIGMMTVIINLLALFFYKSSKPFVRPFEDDVLITTPQLLELVVGGFVAAAFLLFVLKSRWGIKLKAMSDNPVLFETMGNNVSAMRTWVFLLSGAIIAIASCLSAYDLGVESGNGFMMLTYAMVAMIVGGSGRYWTCLAGGLLLGFLQEMVGSAGLSGGWKDGVTFLLLLLFLFLRPQGLAGYKQRTV
jgi:branched-chain amino acid transport system permease protein